MEICDGQKVLYSCFDPLLFLQGLTFGAVPVAARVVGCFHVAAILRVALIPMAAKGRGSACLDCSHGSQLIEGQRMGFSVSRAVLTEDIRNLDAVRRPHRQ